MARRRKQAEPLPTIWRVDDALWEKVEKVLEELDPPARFGPERIDQRKALDGVIYRMRGGVQWNQLPREFGDDASVHRTFQRFPTPLPEPVQAARVRRRQLGAGDGRRGRGRALLLRLPDEPVDGRAALDGPPRAPARHHGPPGRRRARRDQHGHRRGAHGLLARCAPPRAAASR